MFSESVMRTMRLSSVLMMGLAFTAGLVLGLLAHLPKVSSPLETSDTAAMLTLEGGNRRHLRSVAEATDGDDGGPVPFEASDVGRRASGSWTNGSRVYLPQANRSASISSSETSGQQNPVVSHVGASQSISDLQAAIQSTSDSIQALRHDSIFTQQEETVANIDSRAPEQSHPDPSSRASQGVKYRRKGVQVRVGRTKQASGAGKTDGLDGDRVQKFGTSAAVDGRSVAVGDPSEHTKQADTDETLIPSDQHPKLTLSRQQTPSRLPSPFETVSDIITGCYWRPEIEMATPRGYTDADITKWRSTVDHNQVVSMENGCGRMQNRLLTLRDASLACARYRINTDQIQGEIYSYYLARLLGISNIPPSVLARPDPSELRWSSVRGPLVSAEWSSQKVAVLTPWQVGLEAAYIPRELRDTAVGTDGSTAAADGSEIGLHPTEDLLANRTLAQLTELVQWSDLIVLDYLTANVDRVVNNLFNHQWNAAMMHSPAHNLEKSAKSNLLVFLDNESGLFHSYRLLDKYSHYHQTLLDNLCIYRKSTADIIKRLHQNKNAGKEVMDLFKKHEPLHKLIPRIPDKNMNTLQERISQVYEHITKCEQLYPA